MKYNSRTWIFVLFILVVFILIFIIDEVQGFNAIVGGGETNMPMIIFVSSCTENWSCGEWSTCANSSQTRTCTDLYVCGTNSTEPASSQVCDSGGAGGGTGTGVDEEVLEETVGRQLDISVAKILGYLFAGFVIVITLFIIQTKILVPGKKKKKKKK